MQIDLAHRQKSHNGTQGLVLVSTGVLQLVKLSACNASNGKLKINANNELAYAA